MAKLEFSKLDFNSFINQSKDIQIEYIEKRAKIFKKRLPSLKHRLTMADDKSDDFYNMSENEFDFAVDRYIDSVRFGEITTKASRRSYENFINQLQLFTALPIKDITSLYTKGRMDKWEQHVKALGLSEEEEDYLERLLDMMSDKDKEAFVRSKYFLDVGKYPNQSAEFSQFTKEYGYNVVIVKLEIFLQNRGYETDEVYKSIKGYSDEFKVKATRQKNEVYSEKGKAYK